jgi:formylglycine-generating enzyme required for sulfatase activity
MAFIPGGSFALGGVRVSAGQTVSVGGFCIDLTEVTVGAYAACVKAKTCTDDGLECNPTAATWGAGDLDLPLNCVSWYQSDAYCKFAGKRLATEDEWEWAARGGTNGTKYPWGPEEDWGKVCASTPERRPHPCKVGSFPAGDAPHGVHDLAGSVWEWTVVTRPQDWRGETGHSIRGGGWDIVIGFPSFGADSRVVYEPGHRSKAIGFRCAK